MSIIKSPSQIFHECSLSNQQSIVSSPDEWRHSLPASDLPRPLVGHQARQSLSNSRRTHLVAHEPYPSQA